MRAAFYESDITPPLGGYMTGYYRERRAEDVYEKLFAKALVVEDNGNIAAIVAIDACLMTDEIHDVVTKRIYEYTGIKPECVSVSATHTHKGIPITDSPAINCFADKAYVDVCYRLVADAVILAYKRLGDEEVEISYGSDIVTGLAFNRDSVLIDGTHETAIPRNCDEVLRPLGEVDESFNIVTFSKGGKKIGAIVNYSLHLDTSLPNMAYCGDYAAIISEILKEEYGYDFVSLFVTGACGNVNHINHDINIPLLNHRQIGAILGKEAIRIIGNSEPVKGGVSVCKELVTIEKRQPNDEAFKKFFHRKTGEVNKVMMSAYLYYLNSNKEIHKDFYIQAIKIGDVAFSILPGEIYTTIGLAIKRKSPYSKTIIIELANTATGYIPNKEVFGENCWLYESLLCEGSCLVPEASEIIKEKALELLNKI